MRTVAALSAMIFFLGSGGIAQADVFNMGQGLTNLETVVVGDPGNSPYYYGNVFGTDYYYGAVAATYRMGKYEVTSAQYCDFLKHKAKADPHGLYSDQMGGTYGCNIDRSGSDGSYQYSVGADWANRPVNCVGLLDACRFANWLHNGQGDGDTETGAYTITSGSVVRNPGAQWFLPNRNEWYKAAYYKGGGTDAGYWLYPTQSDEEPTNQVVDPDPGNNANYAGYYEEDSARPSGSLPGYCIGEPYYRTNVGEFENSESAYGTFDQAGNVLELYEETQDRYAPAGGDALFPGGTSGRDWVQMWDAVPSDDWFETGFRVAAAVPEPSSLLALLAGLGGFGAMLRKRRRG